MLAGGMINRLSAISGTGQIQRATTAADAGGTPVKTWAGHLQGLQCVVQIRSGAESIRYGRETTRRFGTAYAHGQLDITAGDRLIYAGNTYDIQSVRVPDERPEGDTLTYTILEVEETDH